MTLIRLLILAASVLLLMLPHLPASMAGYLVMVSMAALLIIPVNLLLTLFGSRWWRVAHGVVLLPSLPLLMAYVPMHPREASNDATKLRIVSWNVNNFKLHSDTMLRVARHIDSLQVDIACLQERPHNIKVAWDDICRTFLRYPYAVRNKPEKAVLNMAILSRYPIVGHGERLFEHSRNEYMWADLQVGGDTLRVFNVHLQTTGIRLSRKFKWHTVENALQNAVERDRQNDQLCLDIASSPHPVMVCGDFNDTPCGYPARNLRRRLTDFSNRWPLQGSFLPIYSMLKIDYMFCSPTLRPLRYELTPPPWSDHKMQFGEVEIHPCP